MCITKVISIIYVMWDSAGHAAHTHHNLTHMLPQYRASYNDVILLIVSTEKVTLARISIDSLMMVRTDRNM